MSLIPDNLKYTPNHEWIRMEDDFIGVCGITDYLQLKLTDVLFVDLPDIDIEVRDSEKIVVLESMRDIYHVLSPVSGLIVEVNEKLLDNPELINNDPYEDGWIFKLDVKRMIEYEDLMDKHQYADYLDSGHSLI